MGTFKEAVLELPEIANCFMEGLQALGSNSEKIRVESSRSLEGSVDLDGCSRIPNKINEKRWDYIVSYKRKVFAFEIHPANSGNALHEVIGKSDWLSKWMMGQNKIKLEKPFILISSNRTLPQIPSHVEKKFAQKGIVACGRKYRMDSHPSFSLFNKPKSPNPN